MLRILRQARPHSSMPDIHSKLHWESRLIRVNLKAFEMKGQLPPSFVYSRNLKKGETMWGGGGHFCPDQ